MTGIWVNVMNASTAFSFPLPYGERAFRRNLARAASLRRLRKLHGGKGEGATPLENSARRFPLLTALAARARALPKGRAGYRWF